MSLRKKDRVPPTGGEKRKKRLANPSVTIRRERKRVSGISKKKDHNRKHHQRRGIPLLKDF